jgi:hypothetical protein
MDIPQVPVDASQYLHNLQQKIKVVHDQAKQNLVQRQVYDKERTRKPEDEISLVDKVLLKQEEHQKGKSRKLEPK